MRDVNFDYMLDPPEVEPCPTCNDEGVITEPMEDGSVTEHPCHFCRPEKREPRT